MRLVTIALTALTLVACHPHSAPKPGRAATGSPRAQTSAAVADLRLHPLTCGQGQCPAGLGAMTAVSESGSWSCTGFMANARTFVTNRHCLPDELQNRGANCRGWIAVSIHDGGAGRIIECDRVLDLGVGQHAFAPDFAYLSLAEAAPARLVIDRGGVGDDQTLLAWTVTRTGGRDVIRAHQCRSVLNTLLNPFATSPFAPVSVAVGCDLVPGNSGAPLLNGRDEVVGIAQVRAKDGYRDVLADTVSKLGFRLPDALPAHVNFTNLACVNDPNTGAGPQAACGTPVPRTGVPGCGLDQVRIGQSLERTLTDVATKLPRTFRYHLTYDEVRGTVAAEPVCVVKNSQDVDAWAVGTKVAFTLHLFPYHAIETSLNGITKLRGHVEVDPHLRFTLAFREAEVTPHALDLTHYPIGANWIGTISRERRAGPPLVLPMTVPECSAEQFEGGNQFGFRLRDGSIVRPEAWRTYLTKPTTHAFCPR